MSSCWAEDPTTEGTGRKFENTFSQNKQKSKSTNCRTNGHPKQPISSIKYTIYDILVTAKKSIKKVGLEWN